MQTRPLLRHGLQNDLILREEVREVHDGDRQRLLLVDRRPEPDRLRRIGELLGEPVTAADVQATFDAVMDPKSDTGPWKATLGFFERPEAVDARTVRFRKKGASPRDWRDILNCSSFWILPRRLLAECDFNKIGFVGVTAGGGYQIVRAEAQVETELRRHGRWWCQDLPAWRGLYNFDRILVRYYADNENAFEALKKRKIDFYPVYTARLYDQETGGKAFAHNWLLKRRVRNRAPIGFQGFAMNKRRAPFDDVRVRRAMAALVDRETMNRTMMSGAYFLLKSYYPDLYDGAHPCPNELHAYDPDKAARLLAAAGCAYAVGRESNATYGETVNGNAPRARGSDHHNFLPGVDPYVVKGDPTSGLLPNVEPFDPSARAGDGDRRVQAYCFRMCLTDVPENRIPFVKPAGYRELDYELLFRNFEAQAAAAVTNVWGAGGLPWINSKMPNRKTDTNNRTGFSTDFVGRNWAWPEATYAEREKILKEHLDYQRGLMWTLANHPRIPAAVRREVSRWGTCRDEFADGLGDGWQRQLYVREGRRLIGEYVMTEHNCRGDRTAPHPVAFGAYGMDSHHVRRMVTAEGFVRNEGNVEDRMSSDGKTRFPPYPIDYGAIVPKRADCGNLFVPVCLSASHIAFGSIRMEPVFFSLGQVAGAAAALAIDGGTSVQDVDYGRLRARLAADGIPLPK